MSRATPFAILDPEAGRRDRPATDGGIDMTQHRVGIRRLVTLALAAVVLAAAVASPVAAANAKHDLAWGSGTRAARCSTCALPSFQFNASSDPDGSNATGSFYSQTAGDWFNGTVTCLDVSGKTATLFGSVNAGTGPYDPTAVPLYFLVVVQDLGTITKRHPSPDLMTTIVTADQAEWANAGYQLNQICADSIGAMDAILTNGHQWLGLVSGDLTVIDR
jgi:hypothetical protein